MLALLVISLKLLVSRIQLIHLSILSLMKESSLKNFE